ncbi:hypothetical protein M3Y99_00435500 [Aphelenchoides fujianensis]|nr:hypothetical protein M3Y99_00435500 [Aphelenchoides fujianensis]
MREDDYELYMSGVRDYLVGLDEVEKELKTRINIVRTENSGTALIVLGPRSSGKRSIVRRVMAEEAADMIVIVEDGEFGDGRDSKEWTRRAEEAFNNDADKKVAVVMHNFDRIGVTVANKVLYWFAQQQKLKPYLLILVSENADARQSLEKRIASRIGQNAVKVRVEQRTLEGDWEAVRQMVADAAAYCSAETKRLLDLPVDPPAVFRRLWAASRCDSTPFPRFKDFAAELGDAVFPLDENERARSAVDFFEEAESRPIDDPISHMLNLRPDVRTADRGGHRDAERNRRRHPRRGRYKRFCNQYRIQQPSLRFDENEQFATDIEFLVSRGFWTAKAQNEQILFVYWEMDPLVLLNEKHRRRFHTQLQHWISEDLKDETRLL